MSSAWDLDYALDRNHKSFVEDLVLFWKKVAQPLQRSHALLDLVDDELIRLTPSLLEAGGKPEGKWYT